MAFGIVSERVSSAPVISREHIMKLIPFGLIIGAAELDPTRARDTRVQCLHSQRLPAAINIARHTNRHLLPQQLPSKPNIFNLPPHRSWILSRPEGAMPTRTAASRLARTEVDSASEDEFQRSDNDAMLTPDSIENKGARGRAKPRGATVANSRAKAGTRVAKAKTTSTTTAAKRGKVAEKDRTAHSRRRDREVLAERTNLNREREEDWESEEEERAPVKPTRKQPAAKAKAKKTAPTKSRVKKEPEPEPEPEPSFEEEDEEDVEESIEIEAMPPPKNTKKSKKPYQEPSEILEDSMEIDPTVMDDDEEPEPEPEPEPAPKPRRTQVQSSRHVQRAGSATRQRGPTTAVHRRAASASDNERYGSVSDPTLRRQLGEKTRALETMTAKYNHLREQATKEAESNFEKLRRTTEERSKAQDDVIASLKRELATQRSMQSETKTLRAELAAVRNDATHDTTERKRLAEENRSLQLSLQSAQSEAKTLQNENRALQTESRNLAAEKASLQNEIKSLSTKLAAMRTAAAEAPKPAAAAAGTRNQQKAAAGGNGDAVNDAQIRQLKEELYTDLTGLIIRGVKKVDGEDVYDCIQTGRNGSEFSKHGLCLQWHSLLDNFS
jgi:hypothetical protein